MIFRKKNTGSIRTTLLYKTNPALKSDRIKALKRAAEDTNNSASDTSEVPTSDSLGSANREYDNG